MTASYSFNGGASTNLPSGILTLPSTLILNVNPILPTQAGTYAMSITVTDSALSVSTSFNVVVNNNPPRFTSVMPDRIVPLNTVGVYDLK